MQVCKSGEKIHHYDRCVHFSESSLLFNARKQLPSPRILHDEGILVGFFVRPVQADDVGVIESCHGGDLISHFSLFEAALLEIVAALSPHTLRSTEGTSAGTRLESHELYTAKRPRSNHTQLGKIFFEGVAFQVEEAVRVRLLHSQRGHLGQTTSPAELFHLHLVAPCRRGALQDGLNLGGVGWREAPWRTWTNFVIISLGKE
mmetsp:Transcript_30235/g.78155  ORF Transcript_30235/g.78155 Transcript_30235/m.78155 type:complete len:203 (-) Transcript_30235:537-1145(-)